MTRKQAEMFGPTPDQILHENHYLGPTRGDVYQDDAGVILSKRPPSSRHLPTSWVELCRWCIVSKEKNAGSMQWASWLAWARDAYPGLTTVVSYSDPSVSHDGALYRACNWRFAPTWQFLRPPPSGGGSWDGVERQTPKARWVFPVAQEKGREEVLRVKDSALERRMPFASYVEPRWKRGRPTGGGGDYRATMEAIGVIS